MTLGRGRIRAISGHESAPIDTGWEVTAVPPNSITSPDELTRTSADWVSATVPSTAASTLSAAGRWSLDGPPRDFDADDWWYRTSFQVGQRESAIERWLAFDGLATIATVWLNGEQLLTTNGMFARHSCAVDEILQESNEITIRFHSLGSAMAFRRPRPRWRVPMLEQQQLRWYRATLLGRTPGWSPPAAAVGPWRPIRLESRREVHVGDVRLRAEGDGTLEISLTASELNGRCVSGADVVVERDGIAHRASLTIVPSALRAHGRLTVPNVALWWPHTHGEPALYNVHVQLSHSLGTTRVELGRVGFRSIALVTRGGDFALRLNGAPIFCRGGVWNPLDPVSLSTPPNALERAMALVTAAGMNMLRVAGTTIYESDDFLDACDARGILLWQDFMFANMDYPGEDEGFLRGVEHEARQELLRWQGRPSLTILCGNSEGAQQAAMWGAPRESWEPPLFHESLATLAYDAAPGIPYIPSSATVGAFPHQPSTGVTSYYGVGAYLRPLEDARRSAVRFASECLAFSNVPTAASMDGSPLLRSLRVHHPRWKERVPRDLGAGWDFEDVRDQYLKELFGIDAVALRTVDHARYLELSRVLTGEVMARVLAEWRRGGSATRGALVLALRDLWSGAGWGLIAADGEPKPAWYVARRAMLPVSLALSDEGLNGLDAHITNDFPTHFRGSLELALLGDGESIVERATHDVEVTPHDSRALPAASLFPRFIDLNHAYRFGESEHDVVAATLRNMTGTVAGRAAYFVGAQLRSRERDVGLTCVLRQECDSTFVATFGARRIAQWVALDVPDFDVDDNFFHVFPHEEHSVRLRARWPGATPSGSARPINAHTTTRFAMDAG